MTQDQTILLAATNAAVAMMADDSLVGKGPEATVNQFFKYLDTTVPAYKKRAEYYQEKYGLDLTTTGGDGENSVLGDLAKAAPDLLSLVPKFLELFSSFKK